MPRCQCPACSPTPSPTWTRAWALQCEARMVLRLSQTTSHEYLLKVKEQRGEDSANALAEAMRKDRNPAPHP